MKRAPEIPDINNRSFVSEKFDDLEKLWKRLRHIVFFDSEGRVIISLDTNEVSITGNHVQDSLQPHIEIIDNIDSSNYQGILRFRFDQMVKTGRGFLVQIKYNDIYNRTIEWSFESKK